MGANKGYYGRYANGKFKSFSGYEFSRETAREKVKKAEDQNKQTRSKDSMTTSSRPQNRTDQWQSGKLSAFSHFRTFLRSHLM